MGNEKFKNACEGIAQNVPPVWMMRQAGRYHQHYQALRKKHSFIELCKDPDLAAEVAMGPMEEFDFDTVDWDKASAEETINLSSENLASLIETFNDRHWKEAAASLLFGK